MVSRPDGVGEWVGIGALREFFVLQKFVVGSGEQFGAIGARIQCYQSVG